MDAFNTHEHPVTRAPVDYYKRIIETITLVVIVGGLYFAYIQVDRVNTNIFLSTWNSISNQTIELDKVFIANSELIKYFYDGHDISEQSTETAKAKAMAFLVLDYIDSAQAFIEGTKEIVDERAREIMDENTWRYMFNSFFRTSPILCKTLFRKQTNLWLGYQTDCRKKLSSQWLSVLLTGSQHTVR